MDAIRIRKFGGVASIVVGVLVAGTSIGVNDPLAGSVGVLCALIGVASLYDLHAAA